MSAQPPWMYSAEQRNDSRFPTSTFDPKAVTRASWEKKPPRPKQNGPYLAFNRHPDAHMVLGQRSGHVPMSHKTKKWIKWIRQFQLALRVLQLNGTLGVLVLMVLLTGMSEIKGWIMKIVPGVLICHCIYAIYHLSRDAAGRTPTSSAAYQVFSAAADLVALGFFAFAAFTTHGEASSWSDRISGGGSLTTTLTQTAYYTMVGTGGLHLISLCASLWLAWSFRKISSMPPDMNPLEDNLTARPKHKKKNSSVSTFASSEGEKRFSAMSGDSRPQTSQTNSSRPQSVPFMHTRADFPSRQYQIVPGNSPRNSVQSYQSKRMSRPVSAYQSSYTEVPTDDLSLTNGHKKHDSVDSGRGGKFVEAWAPTESLVSRTNQRNKNVATAMRQNNRNSAAYAAVPQRYDLGDSSDSEGENENRGHGYSREYDLSSGVHPAPLASNPAKASRSITSRAKTPYYPPRSSQSSGGNTLSEMSPNRRRVSESKDITEMDSTTSTRSWHMGGTLPREPVSDLYAKPYGDLKSATPPVMIGNDRKVSGNDYGVYKDSSTVYGRRNVSGKVAEEGRAGNRGSYYGFFSGR